jgi:hypothetical protein
VHFLSKPVKDGTTGTVIVLTTPDAQHTMLAYQVSSYTYNFSVSVLVGITPLYMFMLIPVTLFGCLRRAICF